MDWERASLERAKKKWGSVVFLSKDSSVGRKMELGTRVQMSSSGALVHLKSGKFTREELIDSLMQTRKEVAPEHFSVVPSDMFAGKSVLDFGCGAGVEMLRFLPHVKTIIGTDVVASNVQLCRELLPLSVDKKWSVYTLNDYSGIPALGLYDVVYSCGVLHHLDDLYWRERKIKYMKPSGLVVKVVRLLQQCCGEQFVASAVYQNMGVCRWKPEDLAEVVEGGGMKVVTLRTYNKGKYFLLDARR